MEPWILEHMGECNVAGLKRSREEIQRIVMEAC